MKINKTYQRTPAELFEELKTAEDPAKHLRENLSFGVSTVLQLAFNPRIVLDLPDGEPPYVPDPGTPDRTISRYDNAIKAISVCTKEYKTPSYLKEKAFIGILESVSAQDAKILIAAKDKKLTELYPQLSLDFIRKAAPEFLK